MGIYDEIAEAMENALRKRGLQLAKERLTIVSAYPIPVVSA